MPQSQEEKKYHILIVIRCWRPIVAESWTTKFCDVSIFAVVLKNDKGNVDGETMRRNKSLLFTSYFSKCFLLSTIPLLSLSFIKNIYFDLTLWLLWEVGLVGSLWEDTWLLLYFPASTARWWSSGWWPDSQTLGCQIPYIGISLPGVGQCRTWKTVWFGPSKI